MGRIDIVVLNVCTLAKFSPTRFAGCCHEHSRSMQTIFRKLCLNTASGYRLRCSGRSMWVQPAGARWHRFGTFGAEISLKMSRFKIYACFVGDGQQVEHTVGGTA